MRALEPGEDHDVSKLGREMFAGRVDHAYAAHERASAAHLCVSELVAWLRLVEDREHYDPWF